MWGACTFFFWFASFLSLFMSLYLSLSLYRYETQMHARQRQITKIMKGKAISYDRYLFCVLSDHIHAVFCMLCEYGQNDRKTEPLRCSPSLSACVFVCVPLCYSICLRTAHRHICYEWETLGPVSNIRLHFAMPLFLCIFSTSFSGFNAIFFFSRFFFFIFSQAFL